MNTELNAVDQKEHLTYKKLRYMAAMALILLPLIIPLSAYLLWGHRLQDSLSDYYYVVKDGNLPRSLFVMFLAFISGVFIAYRGIDDKDNLYHNIAGFFAFCVAVFPMKCNPLEHPGCLPGILPVLHLPSAGLLYISAVLTVYHGGGSRLQEAFAKIHDDGKLKKEMRKIQVISFSLMTIGIIAFIFHGVFKSFWPDFQWFFWIEYVGFFGFGIYWLRLTTLIKTTNRIGLDLQEKAIAALKTAAIQLGEPLTPPTVIEETRWDFIP